MLRCLALALFTVSLLAGAGWPPLAHAGPMGKCLREILEARRSPRARGATRCAFCHDSAVLGSPSLRICPECEVMIHRECCAEVRVCPTLGCKVPTRDYLPALTSGRLQTLPELSLPDESLKALQELQITRVITPARPTSSYVPAWHFAPGSPVEARESEAGVPLVRSRATRGSPSLEFGTKDGQMVVWDLNRETNVVDGLDFTLVGVPGRARPTFRSLVLEGAPKNARILAIVSQGRSTRRVLFDDGTIADWDTRQSNPGQLPRREVHTRNLALGDTLSDGSFSHDGEFVLIRQANGSLEVVTPHQMPNIWEVYEGTNATKGAPLPPHSWRSDSWELAVLKDPERLEILGVGPPAEPKRTRKTVSVNRGSPARSVCLLDAIQGQLLEVDQLHAVVGYDNGRLGFWDTTTGGMVAMIPTRHQAPITRIERFGHNGIMVVSSDRVSFWNSRTRGLLYEIPLREKFSDEAIRSAEVSEDGTGGWIETESGLHLQFQLPHPIRYE